MCGERVTDPNRGKWLAGSSPRVRGTGHRAGHGSRPWRFIPACAGNGRRKPARAAYRSVHPRVCGERAPVMSRKLRVRGSSPRVRGTVAGAADDQLHERFIPACAGNGSYSSCDQCATAVHPRVCGERAWISTWSKRFAGSSPRVRGTGHRAGHGSRPWRFIPACAGNGNGRWRSGMRCSVHPRVCGERSSVPMFTLRPDGSSPRVRGTGMARLDRRRLWRFIPACAGNGPLHAPARHQRPVHPRVCGERALCRADFAARSGSSPRVRGTGLRYAVDLRLSRFIPACAGNGQPSLLATIGK